ncbi:solute carrier family 46 member 3-like [Biomphalaria glabrata]|uniref:Solute carrier family 46 member 3-like n=2 Tax=Biomphalaria TaxID=6525 RepID=A0A9W2ZY30_BIOGL|nr:solute carrier family 46 member 3-like [Biomphalaria glabrata]KAI8785354.1 solute carrier family 46 member 3 [Biomphalaria glabrata]KAK0043520.1 solute carrier family 46 member 3 [Biomphalaria pfeifferi]
MSSTPEIRPKSAFCQKVYSCIDTIQIYFVEIALFFFFLNRHMSLPLFQEYVESQIYIQHGVSFPGFGDMGKNTSLSDPAWDKAHHESVLAVLGLQIAEGLPAIVTVIILGAVSDKTGRHKILLWLPALGSCVHSMIYILILYTQWNIDGLFLAAALRGLSGSMTAFLAGSSFYAINNAKPEHRLNRLAVQEFLIGGAYAVGNIMVGFWVKDAGFLKPFWFTLICGLISFLISFFLVQETRTGQESQHQTIVRRQNDINCCTDTFGPLVKYLKCFGNSTLTRIWLAILVFQAYAFVHIGQINTLVLYLSQQKYLFALDNSVTGGGPWAKIGLFLAVIMAVAALATGVCVPIFQKFLSDTKIVFLGFASKALGTLWIAVIRNETILYFAILLLAFELFPFPILRAKVARNVSPSEQGTVFAMMHCGESITYFLAPFMFSVIYASTMSFYSGFVFIVSMIFLTIPVVLLILLQFVEARCPNGYQEMENESCSVTALPINETEVQNQSILTGEPISFISLTKESNAEV